MSSLDSNEADDDWGVFSDAEDNWGGEEVETANPLITQERDEKMHSPPSQANNAIVAHQGPVSLVAVFDDNNEPMVARTVMKNGRPELLEEYRRPTQDEYNSIMFGGKIVRGGVVAQNSPTGTNVDATMRRTPLGNMGISVDWKKLALYSGVGVLAIGGGWYGYKKLKARKKSKR